LLDRLQDGLGENKSLIRKVVAADFERQSQKFGQSPSQREGEQNEAFFDEQREPGHPADNTNENTNMETDAEKSVLASGDEADIDALMKSVGEQR